MKKNLLIITSLVITLLSVSVFANSSTVLAANTVNGNGQALEIAPPVITLTADPGEMITTKISLRDISGGDLVVTGEINDFVASGEDGTPKIILDDTTEANPYSIKNWISPLPELTLKAKQIESLPVTIIVPADAAPGGYYGVVRFTGTPPELKGTGVSLTASLGALILLRVNGDVKENITIEEFSINKNGSKSGNLFETTPLQFVERFKNSGNIHEKPVGQITITDMFGKKVAAINVNLQTNNVLPSSIRKFDQTLDSTVIGNKMLFGRYTANLKVTYGTNKQELTQSITFWVIPYTLIGFIIILIIGGFITLRYAIKRYNQHIRNQALGIKSAKKKKRNKTK